MVFLACYDQVAVYFIITREDVAQIVQGHGFFHRLITG
jgi:hypothetical protein